MMLGMQAAGDDVDSNWGCRLPGRRQVGVGEDFRFCQNVYFIVDLDGPVLKFLSGSETSLKRKMEG